MTGENYTQKIVDTFSIVDRIRFFTNENIEKVILRYLDGYENEKVQEFIVTSVNNLVTLEFNKTLVKDLYIEIPGVSNIENIEISSYPIENFSITEDVQRKIASETLVVTSSPAEGTKPISRAFDGDLNTELQLKKYTNYAWVHMVLPEERLIDCVRMLSYRSATSGLVKKFKVLVRNPMDQSWAESGTYVVDTFKNEWLTTKTSPYLTKEICIIIEDSENKWAYINEIEIYNYCSLEGEILELFTDSTLTDIKSNVTYKLILSLMDRVLYTEYYRELLNKALNIYLEKEIPAEYTIAFDELKVIDNINFKTYGDIETYSIKYLNSANKWIEIVTPLIEENEYKYLNIPKILTKEVNIKIYGVNSLSDVTFVEHSLEKFALIEDIDKRISKDEIEISSTDVHANYPLSNMLDGNLKKEARFEVFKGYHDITFKLHSLKLVDIFKFVSTRFNPDFTSGCIKKIELLTKDYASNSLVSMGEYIVEEFIQDWNIFKTKVFLTDEIVLRVLEADRDWIVINEIEIYNYSLLEKAIKDLFINNELTALKNGVTYWQIQDLKNKVKITDEYMNLLNIAEDLYYADKNPATLNVNFENLKIIDNFQFKVNGIIEKKYIGYVNTLDDYKKLEGTITQEGDTVTVSTEKFLTKNLVLSIYGVTEIKDLVLEEHPLNEYALTEDIDRKIISDSIEIISKNENTKFPLRNMLDGNLKSESHISQTFIDYHDITFKIDKLKVLDKFRLVSTRFNPDFTSGSITRFEILSKDLSTNSYDSLGEYLAEDFSNDWRELEYPPTLTNELILRVHESDRDWVCTNEIEILNFSILGAKIKNLFGDKWYTTLRSGVTFEEIKELSNLVVTDEYKSLIDKAFELYFDGVPPKYINLDFEELKIFSGLKFSTNENVEKILLSYYDTYNNLRVVDCPLTSTLNECVINLDGYAYTRGIKLEIYGASNVENIQLIEHKIEEFALVEDLDERVSYDELQVSCDYVNSIFPLSNMFDSKEKTDFRSKGHKGDLIIDISLNKPMLINEIGLLSFRFDNLAIADGAIRRAEILIKDTVSKEWLQYGYIDRTEITKELCLLKNSPYIVQEIRLKVMETQNVTWVLVNELLINKYSLLENEIRNLFVDESYSLLKEDVTYIKIKELKKRVTNSEELGILIEKAMELYFASKTPILGVIPVDENVIFDSIQCEVIGEVERVIFEYTDIYGTFRERMYDEVTLQDGKLKLNLPKIHAKEALIKIYGITTLYSVQASTHSLKEFSIYNDTQIKVNSEDLAYIESTPLNSSYTIEKAFDDNSATSYRTKKFVEKTDVVLKLSKESLIEKIRLHSFIGSLAGIVNSYEVFVKNTFDKQWISFGSYTSEEVLNDWSEVKNIPYLTDEIKLSVTEANGDWALINEIQIQPLNLLKYHVNELFKDDTFIELKDEVTLEEISNLEKLITKDSKLIKKIQLARFLFESIESEEIEIPLDTVTIFDQVEFIIENDISKIHLKYTDTLGYEREKEVSFEIYGEKILVNFEKIITDKASLVIYGKSNSYGLQKVYQLKTNSYSFEEFSIDEDIDTRVQRKDFSITNSALNGGYNDIERLFDGDLSGQVHFRKTPGGYVKLKLNKPMLIEAGRVMSYRSSTSGFLEKYKISLKNNFDGTWADLGTFEREGYLNEWLSIKGTKYLTDEIWFDFQQGVNNWTLINEVEVFIYNLLEEKINNLFQSDECLELKDTTTLDDILVLLEKDLYTQEYIDKLLLAKKLCLEKIASPVEIELKNNSLSIVSGIEIEFEELPESIYDISVEYKGIDGSLKSINGIKTVTDFVTKKITANIEEIVCVNPKIQLVIDEDEKWKVINGKFKTEKQAPLYNDLDISNIYPKEMVNIETSCENKEDLLNILDEDTLTYYQNSQLGSFTFKFDERKIIDRIRILSEIPSSSIGRIYSTNIYYRKNLTSKWEILKKYEIKSPTSLTEIEFLPTLVKEIKIDILKTNGSQIVLNSVEFDIFNKLNYDVDNLFEDKDFFTKLRKGVTRTSVNRLKAKLSKDVSLISTKLKIAENIVENGKLTYDVFTLKALDRSFSDYFNKLQITKTGTIYTTPYYLYPNKDQVIVSNRSLKITLSTSLHKPGPNLTIQLKPGINIVNPGDKTGHVFVNGTSGTGDREQEINLYTTDKVTGIMYKQGFTTEKNIYSKDRNLTYQEDTSDSNAAYIEGKNFIAGVGYDWLHTTIPEGNLWERVDKLDELLDFLYYIADANSYFENAIPYKRFLWEGRSGSYHVGTCFAGSYTAYARQALEIFFYDLTTYARSWGLLHEVGHELDANKYHMGLFGEVMNNWFSEEGRVEFTNSVRCAPNLIRLENSTASIYDMDFFDKLAFWFKFRLYYGDKDFFVKYHNIMRNLPSYLEPLEIADRLAVMTTMITGRDASDYFLKHAFPLTAAGIELCNKYPKFTLDIAKINWDNQEEFRIEERKRMYEIYKNQIKK